MTCADRYRPIHLLSGWSAILYDLSHKRKTADHLALRNISAFGASFYYFFKASPGKAFDWVLSVP